MIEAIIRNISSSPRAALFGAVIAVFLSLYYYLRPNHKSLNVPSFNPVNGSDFRNALLEGAAQYPDTLFKLNTTNLETVILPHKYVDEIKSRPENELSFMQEVYDRLAGRHTLIGTVGADPGFIQSVRLDLTRNIARTLQDLQEEVVYAIRENIGSNSDWQPVSINSKLLRIIALLSGRIFVGLPLSRDEEWIRNSIDSTVETFVASQSVWKYHWSIRPFIAPFLKEVRTIHKGLKKTIQLLKPVLARRFAEMKHTDYNPPHDMVQFLMSRSGERATDVPYQAQLQAAISIAAIHTTSMNSTHAIFDLAANPEYIEPLREEITQVLKEDNGVLVKASMTKLRKLDSFIKESQRLNPPGLVAMQRKVMNDITLSDGLVLPKNSCIGLNSYAVSRDPTIYENPDTFDGFRFEKLRAIDGNENKYQFVTTNCNSLAFGHGLHACPGRFFASNEIKVLLAYLILHYDIKLKPGESRPKNYYQNSSCSPNGNAEVLFKYRDGATAWRTVS